MPSFYTKGLSSSLTSPHLNFLGIANVAHTHEKSVRCRKNLPIYKRLIRKSRRKKRQKFKINSENQWDKSQTMKLFPLPLEADISINISTINEQILILSLNYLIFSTMDWIPMRVETNRQVDRLLEKVLFNIILTFALSPPCLPLRMMVLGKCS